MNRENLKKMADYLRGDLQAEFNMKFYNEYDLTSEGDRNVCGTVGCILGHATFLFPKPQAYSFPYFGEDTFEISSYSITFDWLFHARWSDIDNTPIGAAKRIEYLLKNDIPPEWYIDIRFNIEPEIYFETIKDF